MKFLATLVLAIPALAESWITCKATKVVDAKSIAVVCPPPESRTVVGDDRLKKVIQLAGFRPASDPKVTVAWLERRILNREIAISEKPAIGENPYEVVYLSGWWLFGRKHVLADQIIRDKAGKR